MPLFRTDQSVANIRSDFGATIEKSTITCIADTGVKEISTAVALAEV